MRNVLRAFGLFAFYLVVKQSAAQAQIVASSLCDLQMQVAQGEHRTVRVEGVFLGGIEGNAFVNAGCSGRSTYIEFELKNQKHKKRFWHLVDKTNLRMHWIGDGYPVLVVFDGEFYGPPVPDPRMPENVRKFYHPPWGNAHEMTKMVVYSILSVKALPANHPCAPPKSDPRQWPCYQHDPLGHQESESDNH
jgi:hypothetical protein